MYPLFYHKFWNMVFFCQATYIHIVVQETRIIRKLYIFKFFIKEVEIHHAKVVFLLQLVVIVNEWWYNQAYTYLIIINFWLELHLHPTKLLHVILELSCRNYYLYRTFVPETVCQSKTSPPFPKIYTPFFRTDPLLYHKFGNMVIFRSGNLYSLCSPGNQYYQKIIFFFIKKVEIHTAQIVFLLELGVRPIKTGVVGIQA